MPNAGGSLDAKLVEAKKLLHAYANGEAGRVAVAWTGGKDSTLALWLWRQVCGQTTPLALTVDTGCKFPKIISFRTQLAKEWGVDHTVVFSADPQRPPEPSVPLECCNRLKIRPLKEALRARGVSVLVTGIRRDEHPSRAGRTAVERREDQEAGPDYVQLNPLLELNEMDVWAAHLGRGIPYCSLYDQGYRSLGCVPCTAPPAAGFDERSGRNQAKDAKLQQLTALGYF